MADVICGSARLLVSLFVPCLLSGASDGASSVGDGYIGACSEGQFAKSIEILQQELEKNPRNNSIWALRGPNRRLSGKRRKEGSAERVYDKTG